MTPKRLLMPLLAMLIGSASSLAQDAFNQTISTIVDCNPQVAAERALAKAVDLDNADANALANPEVSFSRVWGGKGVGNKLQLDVTQSFDWPGLYGARRKANARQQMATSLLCQWTELDVALQAKQLLIEYVYVTKQIAMLDELTAGMRLLEQGINEARSQGYATELDRRKIAIEIYKLSAQASTLNTRLVAIGCELQSMSGDGTLDLNGIDAYPIEPILTFEEYIYQIEELDPQLAAAAMAEEAEAYGAKVAKMQRFPGFSVGYEHQTELGDHFNGFTIGLSLPIFENRHARAAAYSRADAANSQSQALLSQKCMSTVATFDRMLVWQDRVENYNAVFGDNAYLTLIKKAYDGGELSLLDYITETRYYAEATQAFLEAEYNYSSAMADLNKYSLIRK